jgi:hypothetical protein
VLTLAEALKVRQNPIEQAVLETFVLENPLLGLLPFKIIAGNSYKYNEELTLPGVAFRAVNASYTESTGTVNPKSESLVILGGESDVDRYLVKTQPTSQTDLRAMTDAAKIKALAYQFQDSFLNGDTAVDANSFDGLKKRLTGAQVVDFGTNGGPVIGADDAARHTFLDALDDLISRVPGCQALLLDDVIQAKVLSSLRRLGLVEKVNGALAEAPEIPAYRGIPLLKAGERPDGSNIIPINETQGSSTDASSIYAVKFGRDVAERGVTGLATQEGVFDVEDLGELESKPAYRTRIEGYPGLAIFGGKAAARLRGVRNG